MSRKHFEAVAKRIKAARLTAEEREPIEALARDLADDFAGFAAAFDRTRFLTACGVVLD